MRGRTRRGLEHDRSSHGEAHRSSLWLARAAEPCFGLGLDAVMEPQISIAVPEQAAQCSRELSGACRGGRSEAPTTRLGRRGTSW